MTSLEEKHESLFYEVIGPVGLVFEESLVELFFWLVCVTKHENDLGEYFGERVMEVFILVRFAVIDIQT